MVVVVVDGRDSVGVRCFTSSRAKGGAGKRKPNAAGGVARYDEV